MRGRSKSAAVIFSFFIMLNFLFVLGAYCQSGDTIEGIWLGTLKVPNAELRIALTFSKADDGTFDTTMKVIADWILKTTQ